MNAEKINVAEIIGLAAVLLAGLAFAYLGMGPCDRHQFASMSFAGLSLQAYFGQFEGEANGFFYYLMLGLFNDLFGWSKNTAALFSALSLSGSALLIYLAVRRWHGGRAALYSAMFLVSFNSSIYFSSYIRFYAFGMLMCALVAFLSVLWIEQLDQDKRPGVCQDGAGDASLRARLAKLICKYRFPLLGAALIVALLGVLSAMIISSIIWVAVSAAILTHNWKSVKSWYCCGFSALLLAAALTWSVLFNPWAYALQGKNMEPSWNLLLGIYAKYLGLEMLPGRLPLSLAWWETSLELWIIPAALSLLFLVSGVAACLRQKRLLFPVWSLLPLLLFAYSFVFKPILSVWNLSFVIPALAALMGIGLAYWRKANQYVALALWSCVAQAALINYSWPADTEYYEAWRIRSQYASAPLLLADFQVLERAESSLEPYFSLPCLALDNSRSVIIPVKQYSREADFWSDKHRFNALYGRPVHDGTELSNIPWRLLLGVNYNSWQQFPYKGQGAELRTVLAEQPPHDFRRLATNLSPQAHPYLLDKNLDKSILISAGRQLGRSEAPRALWCLYTSPWCSSEVEPFNLDKLVAALPACRRILVWDCGGVQLCLIIFR
ncbi:MAG: hypothetical protein ACI38Q_08950 [Candidatus Bruticola sp.]